MRVRPVCEPPRAARLAGTMERAEPIAIKIRPGPKHQTIQRRACEIARPNALKRECRTRWRTMRGLHQSMLPSQHATETRIFGDNYVVRSRTKRDNVPTPKRLVHGSNDSCKNTNRACHGNVSIKTSLERTRDATMAPRVFKNNDAMGIHTDNAIRRSTRECVNVRMVANIETNVRQYMSPHASANPRSTIRRK